MKEGVGGVEQAAERLLLDPATRITCPDCEHEFSLQEGFARKSLEQLATASEVALAAERRSVAAAVEARLAREASDRAEQSRGEIESLKVLLRERDAEHASALEAMRKLEKGAAEAQLKGLHEMLAERDAQLKDLLGQQQDLTRRAQALELKEQALQDQIAREARAQAEELAAQARSHLEAELAEKASQIAALQGQELELRRERTKLEEARQALELETQRRLDEQKREIEERVRAGEVERARLREAELQKTIDDMRAKLEEAQRKSEQGSQQLQGEVLELVLEERLGSEFPLDVIEEVKKGVRGGDAIHRVMTRSGQPAGVILWEAKRTAKWGNPWSAKLREDMRAVGAEVGVIITTAFPAGWPPGQLFGLHEDVWVTSPATALPLAAVLREGLLEAYKARVASANKGEKMEAVYDYVTSPQFGQRFKAVGEVFTAQRRELDAERTSMLQRWKRREKQIEIAIVQLANIGGELQGLAQQDLPQLELQPAALEAPEEDEEGDAG